MRGIVSTTLGTSYMCYTMWLVFCYDFNNSKPMVQILKEGFTSVHYWHLSRYSSFIRQKDNAFITWSMLISIRRKIFLNFIFNHYSQLMQLTTINIVEL